MHTLIEFDTFRQITVPVTLAAGFFDGVHRGHRCVLAAAIDQARATKGEAWALTFDQHPLAILAPERCPPMVTTIEQRLDLLAKMGLDGCLMLPFTTTLAALPAETFLAQLTHGPGRPVCAVCCGANWRFGQGARGTPDWLRTQGGVDVTVVPAASYEGDVISSTRIREAIRDGKLAAATAMLGRSYAIRETVRRGRGVARTLGMATANFNPNAEVLPPVGVYAVESAIGDRPVGGVANLGFRPTFADAKTPQPVLEVHFFDFAGDLYGASLEIAFIARVRDERRFSSPAALVQQIHCDIEAAKKALHEQFPRRYPLL